MCWLEVSKGFITNNLFVKCILLFCLRNIHEQEHCFLKPIFYLKCSSGSFKWVTEGLDCKWFPLFSCSWSNKPPDIDCITRLLRQEHTSCANRCVCVCECSSWVSSAPPQATLDVGLLWAFVPLKWDRSTTQRQGVNITEAKPLKIQMSIQWAKDIFHPLWLAPVWPSCGAMFYFSKCSRTGTEQESKWSGEGHELELIWRFLAQAILWMRSGLFNPEAWLKWNRIIDVKDSKLSAKWSSVTLFPSTNLTLKPYLLLISSTSLRVFASGSHLESTTSHQDL